MSDIVKLDPKHAHAVNNLCHLSVLKFLLTVTQNEVINQCPDEDIPQTKAKFKELVETYHQEVNVLDTKYLETPEDDSED